ncbi:FT-interacting protein 1 [Vitis vinifera]|uniref:FT-interacting protein 1 n=1 Tax=Vitis vinifera TaxID=29760 RepID=A0A438HAG7_VITVI|nr:FT-interacting protein 1 [Vitis vinifera]
MQASSNHQEDYKLKDTHPQLGERWPHGGVRGGGGWISSDRVTSTYDLVEQMYYLYVRVVKAKDLPTNAVTGGCDPYVEVKLGNYKGKQCTLRRKQTRNGTRSSHSLKTRFNLQFLRFMSEKEIWCREMIILGKVVFDMNEVPTRVPPDSPLAPQWYRLEDRRGDSKVKGEVMLAVWMGTQADEAFPEAWHSDAATVHGEGVFNIRSKVYVSPKLWYLRVNVIEAQDVESQDKGQLPQVFVKAQVGNQVLKTKTCQPEPPAHSGTKIYSFVAAEPFEEMLVMTIENKMGPSKMKLWAG